MKKSYEVIEDTSVVNMSNEPVEDLKTGATIVGELIQIDGQPYVETEENQKFVSSKALAEKLDPDLKSSKLEDTAIAVKASHKKLIFALVGAGVGFGIGHFMKASVKKKIIFSIGGLALGLVAEYVNNRKK